MVLESPITSNITYLLNGLSLFKNTHDFKVVVIYVPIVTNISEEKIFFMIVL